MTITRSISQKKKKKNIVITPLLKQNETKTRKKRNLVNITRNN
jgi:hypothetical protein